MPYINDVLANNKQKNQEENVKNRQQKQPALSRFLFDPDGVAERLSSKIIGQDDMQQAMCDLLHIVKADFGQKDRPLSVCFFLGPTGVGKTETVKVIAEGILGSADSICRIDMNTLAQEHYMAALTGAPPGYVGSKENHTLFDSEKIQGSYSKPSIVLFDEIEKASQEVVRSLLGLLDTGFLQLSAGTKAIDFRNCMIFMTSNVGARALADHQSKLKRRFFQWWPFNTSSREEKSLLDNALCQHFDPEFINRIDKIITFNAIDNTSLDNILELQICNMNHRLNKKNISIRLDEKAKKMLLQSYDRRYGARDIARHIHHLLNPKIARMINGGFDGNTLNVSANNDQLLVDAS